MFSGYVKDIEDKPTSTPWGSKMPFANLMAEFSNSLNVSFHGILLTQLEFECEIASLKLIFAMLFRVVVGFIRSASLAMATSWLGLDMTRRSLWLMRQGGSFFVPNGIC